MAFEWIERSKECPYCLHGSFCGCYVWLKYTEANPFFSIFYSSISIIHVFIFILPFTGETHPHAQRLTLSVVDTFIEDLKSSVLEAKESPSGTGTMVAIYGTFYAVFVVIKICRLCYYKRRPVMLPFFLFICDINRTYLLT
jgi:hypothetical protein